MILPILFAGPAGEKGLGVFTSENIPANTVIEISPVVILNAAERQIVDQTILHDYIFNWGEDGAACLALGYVSVYNHSSASNCEYEMDYETRLITIRTVRDVITGEELCINYHGNWNDTRPVWFETK
jgi:SET domain-containing protein